MAKLSTRVPSPPLDRFVERFWCAEEYVPAHQIERILPTGSAQLVINLSEDRLRVGRGSMTAGDRSLGGSVLSGPQSEFFVIDSAGQSSVFGIQFKPGGLRPLFGCPASLVADADVPLDELWGAPGRGVRERLLDAPSHADKFRVIEQVLMERLDPARAIDPAAAFAAAEFVRDPVGQRVGPMADRVGLSHRRFIEIFTEQVGLTPKRFCRVQRFQHVIRSLAAGAPGAWAEMALASGYYDQAHFINDFRAFAGVSPAAYLLTRGEHPNHLRHDTA